MSGIFVSCNQTKESLCVSECYDLFNEVGFMLFYLFFFFFLKLFKCLNFN
jgi:hypothetical protein